MLNVLFTIIFLLLALFTGPDIAAAQGPEAQPVQIIVRDGAGQPLAGVTLNLLRSGPPHEPFDTCLTNEAGTCELLLAPGAYLVQFDAGWNGQPFIAPEQQNDAALNDGGAAGGGFGFYIEPGQTLEPITFVVGQREGELVPLWDMSRKPDAAPQPFAEVDIDEISLEPLVDVVEVLLTVAPSLEEASDTPPQPEEEVTTSSLEFILTTLLLVIGFGAALFVIVRLLASAAAQEQ